MFRNVNLLDTCKIEKWGFVAAVGATLPCCKVYAYVRLQAFFSGVKRVAELFYSKRLLLLLTTRNIKQSIDVVATYLSTFFWYTYTLAEYTAMWVTSTHLIIPWMIKYCNELPRGIIVCDWFIVAHNNEIILLRNV